VTARRFFVEGNREIGSVVEIGGGDAHKIAHVLRLRQGDRIEIIDSHTRTFVATIGEIGHTVRATLIERSSEPSRRTAASAVTVDVAQAVPKAGRMELVVEKCTELGANAFLPFYSERSVTRNVGSERLARWQRLARTAAQQCGRREIPEILAPLEFEALVTRFARYGTVLFAWEMAQPFALQERLRSLLPSSGSVLVVVGPEGGFTHNEADLAVQHRAALLWLGPRILRTDTAAIVLLAVIGSFAS
jgi:16S rRNA (uracil1498-N3)-methyltransferase